MKSLTRVSGGSTLTIAPGVVMSARTKGTGTLLRVRNDQGVITNENVTDAVATFIAGTTFLLVTPQDLSGAKYIRAETISGLLAHGTGSMLTLLSDDNGFDQGATLYVTESVATIQARIDAAVIAGGGGGGSTTFASVTAAGTNQATATATTAGKIRITGGAVNTGIVLDGATGGEEREIYNATTTLKFVYPAVGEFIDPGAANEPITLGPNEGVILSSNLAAHWSRYEGEDHQFVAGTGTAQLGGQINIGVQDVTISSAGIGNTAVTLPAGTVGYRITVSNTTATNVRLYPFTGDAITTLGANNFFTLQAGRQAELIMDVAGTWLFASTQVDVLAVSTIQPPTTTGAVVFNDPITGEISRQASTGIVNSVGLQVLDSAGTATAGGNQGDGVQINSNIFNLETVATDGDSATLTGVSNFSFIKNSGVATAFIYSPNTGTMDGVTDGFYSLPAGQSVLIYRSIDSGGGTWISIPAGESAQSLTATPAGTQGTSIKVRGSVVTFATVATALDGATIDPTSGVKEFILLNNAGVSASLFPPVGGTIDGGAVDAAFVVPRSATFLLTTTNGLDYRVYLLPGATQVAQAAAGGGQANGTPIVSAAANFSTVATAGDSASLKPWSPRVVFVANNDATESMDLFPTVGGTINGGAVDAAFAVAAGTSYRVSSFDGLTWLAGAEAGTALTAAKTFIPVLLAAASLTDGQVAGTYALGYGAQAVASGSGVATPIALTYIDAAQFADIDGVARTMRLSVLLSANDVAPTGNYTFGLYPVTRPASSGGAGVGIYDLGSVVVGSTAGFTTPAADSTASAIGTPFAIPATGFYCIGVVTTTTVDTSAHVHLNAKLEVQSV